MSSRKQEIYCQLLSWGILELRYLCSTRAPSTSDRGMNLREALSIGHEHANFLHHIHKSILDPDYVENDIEFINFAFPMHIDQLGNHLRPHIAALMLEFYENVPPNLRPRLEWRPSPDFLQRANAPRSADLSKIISVFISFFVFQLSTFRWCDMEISHQREAGFRARGWRRPTGAPRD